MTVSRTEPQVYWTDMSDAIWQSENAPFSAAWCATLARNAESTKQALYGLGAYLGDVPHVHDTGESAHPAPAVGVNLVQASCPSLVLLNGGETGEWPWRSAGWEIATAIVIFGETHGEDERYIEGGARGGWVSQALLSIASSTQARLMGGGSDMVFSFFARTTTVESQGMLQFGIASSEESLAVQGESNLEVSGPGEFAGGQSGIIHYSDLATSWRRYYVPVRNAGNGLRGEMRLQLSVLQSFREVLQVTGFTATVGRRLYPWAPSPGDVPQTPWGFGHAGWQNMPRSVPLLDWSVAMTDALRIEPI